MSTDEQAEQRPPRSLDDVRELVLELALAVALLVAGGTAWATLAPLIGAGIVVVGTAAWWLVVSRRNHEHRIAAKARAEYRASTRPASLPADLGRPVPASPPWAGPNGRD